MPNTPIEANDLTARRQAESKRSLSLALQRENAARVQQALQELSLLFSNTTAK